MMEIAKTNIFTKRAENALTSKSVSILFVVLFPIAAFLFVTAGLALPFTRPATLWLLAENNLVEMLTFAFLFAAGIYGLYLCRQMRKHNEEFIYSGFYFLFSFGLLLTAMEEIAWGQQFWAFATPPSLQEINMQGETTIHNIRGLHGNTEYFRLAFGLGGLTGICLGFQKLLPKISPPFILITWFLVIAAHATLDVLNDITRIQKEFDAAISWLAELIELLIAFAGFLYLWFNAKKYAADWQKEFA